MLVVFRLIRIPLEELSAYSISDWLQLQQSLSLEAAVELSRAESSSGQDEEELEAVVVGPSASFKPAAACTLG